MYKDIFIPINKIFKAEDGDKVLVKLEDWPENADSPYGKVIQVLGKPGDHNTEIHAILAEYGLPHEFPHEVEEFANKIDTSITKEEIAKRRDMRKDLTFTIDPKDAKDFDDALSFKVLENGLYEIGIHIASKFRRTFLDFVQNRAFLNVFREIRKLPALGGQHETGTASGRDGS